jgi:hypothetical protein
MNSKQLGLFNKKLFSLLIESGWDKKLNISKDSLKACMILAERSLFAESERHPLIRSYTPSPFIVRFMTLIWFSMYSFLGYFANFLIRFIVLIRGSTWRISKAKYYSLSPPGDALDLYLEVARRHEGEAVCILGPNQWRRVFYKNSTSLVYETMLTISPLQWLANYFLLSKNIEMIDSMLCFDSLYRPKVVARFFYIFLKQVTMKSRVEKIIFSMSDKSKPIIVNSESISFLFVERLREQGYKVCHHLHGVILCDNLMAETLLSNYVITGGAREMALYKNKKSFASAIPFQMYEKAVLASSISSSNKEYKYDLLLIASFELPFIQKSTFNILKESFKKCSNVKILLRHHPRAPSKSKEFLEKNIPYDKISTHKDLIKDVMLCKAVVCCSVDALIIPVIMKKMTMFVPMVDGNHSYYTKPFMGVLPNLLCPDSSKKMIIDIRKALSSNTLSYPSNYLENIEFLFGGLGVDKFYQVVDCIAKK